MKLLLYFLNTISITLVYSTILYLFYLYLKTKESKYLILDIYFLLLSFLILKSSLSFMQQAEVTKTVIIDLDLNKDSILFVVLNHLTNGIILSFIYITPLSFEKCVPPENRKKTTAWLILCIFSIIMYIILQIIQPELSMTIFSFTILVMIRNLIRSIQIAKQLNPGKTTFLWAYTRYIMIQTYLFPLYYMLSSSLPIRAILIQNVPEWIKITPIYYIATFIPFLKFIKANIASKKGIISNKLELWYKKNKLSNREKEICNLLIKGKTYNEISLELTISATTVKYHTKNIYKKCCCKNRVELIKKFDNFE